MFYFILFILINGHILAQSITIIYVYYVGTVKKTCVILRTRKKIVKGSINKDISSVLFWGKKGKMLQKV